MIVYAIIVTYDPDKKQLDKVINSILNQTDNIIIVKNSAEDISDIICRSKKITGIQLDSNCGIAYAQNRGIEAAVKDNADFVLFSDQDTIYPENYICSFTKKIQTYGERCIYVPAFYNNVKKHVEPVSVKMHTSFIPAGQESICLFHAISSGTLVSTQAFKETGLFDEKLFIDYVDFEWCWRARRNNYTIRCFPDIMVDHHLGDSYKKFLNRKVTVRSDFRYFYMIRNGFFLSRTSKYLSFPEKASLFVHTCIYALGTVFISDTKLKSLKLIISAYIQSFFV